MAYRSTLDIGLPQVPVDKDPGTQYDRIKLYNAVHILNSRMQSLIDSVTSGEDDVAPWEALRFTRWFWSTAAESIQSGNIVTVVRGRFRTEDNSEYIEVDGLVKGAPSPASDVFSVANFTTPPESLGTGLVGVAMEDGEAGDRVRVGIGPAAIQVPGIKRGDVLLSPTFINTLGINFPFQGRIQIQREKYRGVLLRTFPRQLPSVVVGSGIDDDAAFIYPMVDYYSNVAAWSGYNATWNQASGAGDSP